MWGPSDTGEELTFPQHEETAEWSENGGTRKELGRWAEDESLRSAAEVVPMTGAEEGRLRGGLRHSEVQWPWVW